MKSREDWLVEQLDREDVSAELKAKYEQELDDMAERVTRSQQKEAQAKQATLARNALIRESLLAGDLNVIDAFGIPEFGEDYEVTVEGESHVVYSKVANDLQENRWIFSESDSAVSKFRKLVWDRLYSKYVRSGEVGHLSELAS